MLTLNKLKISDILISILQNKQTKKQTMTKTLVVQCLITSRRAVLKIISACFQIPYFICFVSSYLQKVHLSSKKG